MLRHILALAVGHLQKARKVLACVTCASTYVVGFVHMIKIIIKIKYNY